MKGTDDVFLRAGQADIDRVTGNVLRVAGDERQVGQSAASLVAGP